jgi:formyl-CoA transferase
LTAPLAGLRVLEVATFFAAPQIGAMLGDLGADVVKVEPPAGDPMRRMGVQPDGASRNWAWVSRNKRSVVLDLDDAGGKDRATFAKLVGAADVLVENVDAKTRERWSLAYDDLSAVNPRLVVVSVSAYGLTGPYAGRPGAGTLAEAFGGLTHMTGEADGPPMLPSVPVGDTLTAFSGVIGALAACWSRDAGDAEGVGRHVDVAMYDPLLHVMGATIATYTGDDAPPARTGSRVHGGVPRNVYATRDGGWVAVSGTTDPQVSRLLPLLGLDDDAGRQRYGTTAARAAVADELDGLVATWIAEQDQDAVVDALVDARIPVAPVNDVGALREDPHLQARGDLARFDDAVAAGGPVLGEHTAEVAADWTGA